MQTTVGRFGRIIWATHRLSLANVEKGIKHLEGFFISLSEYGSFASGEIFRKPSHCKPRLTWTSTSARPKHLLRSPVCLKVPNTLSRKDSVLAMARVGNANSHTGLVWGVYFLDLLAWIVLLAGEDSLHPTPQCLLSHYGSRAVNVECIVWH